MRPLDKAIVIIIEILYYAFIKDAHSIAKCGTS